MSASTSRTLPAEIAESESVVALIERGKAEGQIGGDDVRRAFEADQIPPTQWKNVLRSLNQILDEEGVTLMVSAAEAPKRTRKSVAAKTPAKRTATRSVGASTAAAAKQAVGKPEAPAEVTAPAAEEAVDVTAAEIAAEPVKKTVAKKAAKKPAKKAAAKKAAAPKKTAKKSVVDEILEGPDEAAQETPAKPNKPGAEDGPTAEVKNENEGFVLSDDDEDDAPAQQVAA
ncbi:MAG: RNA polymerase sigma factor, partial [Streptomyces sp.]